MSRDLPRLVRDIAACRVCADHLAEGPRPIVQLSATARILIIGQAPGSKVHASGVPWDDDSGNRLRQWIGIKRDDFYDQTRVALMPMGFCYPGKGEKGDLLPRPECAPLWHVRVIAALPENRLTLLVGSYAQERYLPEERSRSMTDRVRNHIAYGPAFFPLPHPSWRSTGWMRKNPWFEEKVLPALRQKIYHMLRLE